MDEYWNDRSEHCYTYKDEQFYTITPIPYYYQRRALVLSMLDNIIKEQHINSVFDMGCGDGEYIYNLAKNNRQISKFHGVDISEKMIMQARNRCTGIPNIEFEISGNGTSSVDLFSMASMICVLAHVEDSVAEMLVKNIYEHLKKDGLICIFEQIAPGEIEGDGWKRRTYIQYQELLKNAGFKLVNKYSCRIDFTLHRLIFERYIAKVFYKRKRMKNIKYERQACNRDKLFVLLSSMFTGISVHRKKKQLNGWGYIFLCARK